MSRPVVVATAANGVAAVIVAACWSAAASRVRVADQLPLAALASTTVMFAALADAAVVVSLRRRVAQRATSIIEWAGHQPDRAATALAPSTDNTSALRVQVSGGRLSHRPSCVLVAGKATVEASLSSTNCSVCSA